MTSDDTATATPLYRHRFVSVGYDALNALLWLPTGSDRLRRQFVDTLDLTPQDRVLELGCGTGLVTRHLSASSERVTAVDRAAPMAVAARRRAPRATVVTADIGTVDVAEQLDWVVVAFVLHELTPTDRAATLSRAARLLSPSGQVAVLDWAQPPGPRRAKLWAATVRAIEPPVAHDILDDGLDQALAAARLTVTTDVRLAGGRARVLHAGRGDRAARDDARPRQDSNLRPSD